MIEYSEELIQKCIRIFKEEEGLDISSETAVEYLRRLGALYLAFSKN